MRRERLPVLLVQLPIPPPGLDGVRGNVPLAAGYLKLFAQVRGLDSCYSIDIFPSNLANQLSDLGLVEEIVRREPWLVGFTCYLWNINRTLWIAEQVKHRLPNTLVLLGGPEITADNAWTLENPAVDFAAIGEGEQTFAELLHALGNDPDRLNAIAGLSVRQRHTGGELPIAPTPPMFRSPLANLDVVSSPYLAGILDPADEKMLLLETIRGCIFKCKFCYYPKAYDDLYFVPEAKVVANLNYARERGAKEVVILDPTLNQRAHFDEFVGLLARCNPDKQFTYFGELRGEGITPKTASLLRQANFTEVEIGLQSVDPLAQELMDRKNNMKAFERGCQAMLDVGIQVKVDLIIGLPGDTVDSVRRGIDYLLENGFYSDIQVFNLSVLPGTAFRAEAQKLGLIHQPRPPYYVLETPTLKRDAIFGLMEEAQDAFGVEFDTFPPPVLKFGRSEIWDRTDATTGGLIRCWRIDTDRGDQQFSGRGPRPDRRSQAFCLWLVGSNLTVYNNDICKTIETILVENPHTTLQVVLEPRSDPRTLDDRFLDRLLASCYRNPTYLDRFYALQPGRPLGAKRLVMLLQMSDRAKLGSEWIDSMASYATLAWRGDFTPSDFAEHEVAHLEDPIEASAPT